jgi:hypothetical protein
LIATFKQYILKKYFQCFSQVKVAKAVCPSHPPDEQGVNVRIGKNGLTTKKKKKIQISVIQFQNSQFHLWQKIDNF